MPEAFDPYYDWLGIPPEEQPPTHYRLLGLNPFEDKLKAIEHAADRQMAHLRTFQNGPHSQQSQRLLNQVSAAKICLLNATKKAAYDQALRQQAPADESGIDHEFIDLNTETRAKRTVASKKNRITIAVSLIVAGIVCMILFALGGNATVGPTGELLSGESPPDGGLPEKRVEPPVSPVVNNDLDAPKTAGPKERVSPAPAVAERHSPAVEPSSNGKAPTLPPSAAPEPVAARTPKPRVFAEPLGQDPPPSASSISKKGDKAVKAAGSKFAVPSQVVQANIGKQLNKVYALGDAKTASRKIELANRMMKLSGEAANPHERFVLLRKAMELASDGGNPELMLRAVDMIENNFAIDRFEMKEKMLAKFAIGAKTPQAIEALVRSANGVIDRAVAAKRYDAALGIADHVYRACQKSHGRQYRKQALERRKQMQVTFKAWEKFRAAATVLETVPNDPNANLAVGCWHCIANNDWPTGLPYLERGADEELKGLARREQLSLLLGIDEQIGLADAWRKRAASESGEGRIAMLNHASDWYQKALPGMKSAMARAKLVKRLEDIHQALRVESIVIWNSRNGNHANAGTRTCNVVLTLRGKTVWRQDGVGVPWDRNSDQHKKINVSDYVFADRVRIEITSWHGGYGSLAEVQVFSHGMNIAKDRPVECSGAYKNGGPRSGTTITDGITTSAKHYGYWLLPHRQPGWAEITLAHESKPKPIPTRGGILVLWNTHNRRYRDRGTAKCNVRLGYNNKVVWEKKDVLVNWDPYSNPKTIVKLPKKRFDTLRVEITAWHKNGGGLAEIELYRNNKNVLFGKNARASASNNDRDFPASCVTDGITGPQVPGIWLLPNQTAGWVEIDCSQ